MPRKRYVHGHGRYGLSNNQTKLNPMDVLEIMECRDLSSRIVAEAYGVHHSTIWAIWSGKTWRWLTGK